MRLIQTAHFVFTVVFLFFVAAAFPGAGSAEKVRRPAVAGSFYPADPGDLRAMIERLTDSVDRKSFTPPQNSRLRAIVMPHAGYIYSGATAAHVSLLLDEGMFERVIVVGPDHRVGLNNGVITDASWFETPLGKLRVDDAAPMLRKGSDFFRAVPKSDRFEHSVEALVPFLQVYLGGFNILPVVAGPGDPVEYAAALSPFLDDKTLLAISSDLSHYLPYAEAVARDRETIDSILALDDTLLRRDTDRACGQYPLRILIGIARKEGWKPVLLDYSNSGDTAGDKNKVVGYAAIAFFESEGDSKSGTSSPPSGAATDVSVSGMFTEEQGGALVALARATITAWFTPRKELKISPEEAALLNDAVFDAHRGVFVTLTLDGRLRGCIGSLTGAEPVRDGVRNNAIKAAFHDPRFPKLTVSELDRVHVEVSILSEPEPLLFTGPEDLASKLRPGIDGVILRKERASATFLPQVWNQLPTHEEFLSHLCRKAGLSTNAWRTEKLEILVYQVVYFEE